MENIRVLSFELSQRCNLKCSYCYLGERKSSIDMNLDVAGKALDLFSEKFNKTNMVDIWFFGGEPLLNFQTIKFIVWKCKKLSREKKIKFNYTVVTNGTKLSQEILKFCSKEAIVVQISLDGEQNAHDSCRKMITGKGSYSSIIQNLEFAKELEKNGIHNRIIARGTVTKKTIPITNVIDHFEMLGIKEYLYIAADSINYNKNINLSANEVKHQAILQINDFKERVLEGRMISDLFMLSCFKIIHSRNKVNYPCGASRTLIGIGADGRLFPCHRYFNTKQFAIGNVWSGVDNKRNERFKPIHVSNKKKCSKCAMIYFCSGTCPYTTHFFGDNQYQDNLYCVLYKTVYTELIKFSLSLKRDNPSLYKKFISKINNTCSQVEELSFSPFQKTMYTTKYKKNSLVKKSTDVFCIDIDDEGILSKNDTTANKYILNTTAMAIWDLIDGHRTAQQITQEIADVCEVEFDTIKDDIYGQLAAFQELGLVEEVAAASHA